jgi:hypothetical protein
MAEVKELTKEQKADYLSNPHTCPYCGGDDIEGGRIETDGNEAWQLINCLSCPQAWNDVYKLSDVEPVKCRG